METEIIEGNKIIDFTNQNDILKYNDLIAVFCGGVLEYVEVFDYYQYRFDEPNTNVYEMKCPPFGVIIQKGMQYHSSWTWLMSAIRECNKKATTDDLKKLYQNIIQSLTDFDFYDLQGHLTATFISVVQFIEYYNTKTKP